MTLKQQTMSHTYYKLHIILLLAGLLGVFIAGSNLQLGYAQTSLQELQNRVAELENKLADAKAREEKAHSVQMQLEEQEQKLAGLEKYLSESEKYRVQVVEIRMDIKSIRAKIGTIIKEKNELEENLQLAKNLQSMLREAQTTARTEVSINIKPVKTTYWKINNVRISNHFTNDERDEIMRFFSSRSQLNQDDLLSIAHEIYNRTGTTIHFIIHQKTGNDADLEIVLNQRARLNFTHGNIFSTRNLSEFKANYFDLKIIND